MFYAPCQDELQPFNRSYSQLTFFKFLQNLRVDSSCVTRTRLKHALQRTWMIYSCWTSTGTTCQTGSVEATYCFKRKPRAYLAQTSLHLLYLSVAFVIKMLSLSKHPPTKRQTHQVGIHFPHAGPNLSPSLGGCARLTYGGILALKLRRNGTEKIVVCTNQMYRDLTTCQFTRSFSTRRMTPRTAASCVPRMSVGPPHCTSFTYDIYFVHFTAVIFCKYMEVGNLSNPPTLPGACVAPTYPPLGIVYDPYTHDNKLQWWYHLSILSTPRPLHPIPEHVCRR